MAAFVADLILAGELGRAVAVWRAEGGGAAGWERAREYIRQRNPDSPAASLNALIRRAQEVVPVGRSYRQAGPNYRIEAGRVPDYRKMELDRIRDQGGDTSRLGNPRYWHQITVEVRDPNEGGRLVQRFGVKEESDSILSRLEFDQLAQRAAGEYLQRFVNYDPKRLEDKPLDVSYVIEGIYRGY